MQLQFLVCGSEVFGKDSSFTDDRHEVGVAAPARDYVQVQMIRDAGSSAATEIHSDVESIGMILGFERRLRALCELDHLSRSCFINRCKGSLVLIRHNHQMTARVGKQVKNN